VLDGVQGGLRPERSEGAPAGRSESHPLRQWAGTLTEQRILELDATGARAQFCTQRHSSLSKPGPHMVLVVRQIFTYLACRPQPRTPQVSSSSWKYRTCSLGQFRSNGAMRTTGCTAGSRWPHATAQTAAPTKPTTYILAMKGDANT